MPQQRSNKAQTPINSDAFNLTPDLATLADTLGVVVPVADRAEGDTVATARAAAGWPVSDSRPLYVWCNDTKTLDVKDSSGWRGGTIPFGHMGRTDLFQTITTEVTVGMSAAQILKGGVTFDNATDSLVVPISGYYRVSIQAYGTGSWGATYWGLVYKNSAVPLGPQCRFWKGDSADHIAHASGIVQLTAGDKVYVAMGGAQSTWGSSGFNGTYLEVEWISY